MSTGRYILFGGSAYYARGGWHDKLKAFDSLDEARNAALKWRTRQEWMDDEDYATVGIIEWWHILDIETCSIVDNSKRQAYGADDAIVRD